MSEKETAKKEFLKWKRKKGKGKSKTNENSISSKNSKKQWKQEVEKIKELEEKYDKINEKDLETFEDFPLSLKTKAGLRKAGFLKPTAIQKASIVMGLRSKDVLGAAKTGSGKTLAFLIPILECLYRHSWNSMDGPGALVISPTRELAFQTFEVLQRIGCKHNFSAGLVIGGKNIKDEAANISKTNIVICTPGRLLEHMDKTTYFRLENLKMLILDEADRILDMGFSATINSILENLPTEKQTLLFSATQTKSVKDLARLSLEDPVYVSVHAEAKHSTPNTLSQRYSLCPLEEKLSLLYSFIKNHIKSKTLVFVTSCKQAQYLFNLFCRLRPGVPILHLHGKLNQIRRMAVYQEFCRKKFAVLIATDIAARGLDFPSIDWVLQLDCPEDSDTYIHRVGRTARFNGNGNALLVVLPSEQNGILAELNTAKVPIEKSTINVKKLTKIDARIQSLCAEDKELKERAQRCFVSYIRSIHLMKNKKIFQVKELPLEKFSASLGLAIPPRVRFLQRHNKQIALNKGDSTSQKKQREFDVSDDDGELFNIKPIPAENIENLPGELEEPVMIQKKVKSKAAIARKLLQKGRTMNQKIIFDDEGKVEESMPPMLHDGESSEYDLEKAKIEMRERDMQDREKHRNKVKARHKEIRQKAKEKRREENDLKKKRKEQFVDNDFDVQLDHNLGDDNDFDDIDEPSAKRQHFDNYKNHDVIANNTMTLTENEDLALSLLNTK